MADHTVGARDGVFLKLRLLANRLLKSSKLALGESNQERFKDDDGFSKAGIQVVVVRVNISPHFYWIQRVSFGKVFSGAAKILAEIHDHLFQGAYFMKELKAVGEQHMIEEAAHARGALDSLSLKIGRVQRRSVGNGSVMLGVFGQSTKQTRERLGQELAKARSNPHSQEGLAGMSKMPEFEGLVE